MNVVFMGTPEFAIPSLKMLIDEKYNIVAVVTQPDKPKGRGKKNIFSEVKELAVKHNLLCLQPKKIKGNNELLDELKELKPDLFITAAYGKILSKEILDIPKYGCVNVHGSILPKYRGSAPIHWAVINGEKKTGITTMMTDIGMDTGDILEIEECEIHDNDTVCDVHDRLSVLGAKVLKNTLDKIKNNTIKRIPQDNTQATYAPMMNKEMGEIDWSKNAVEIHNLVRGTNPWPMAFTFYNGDRMKVWKTEVVNQACTNEKPGTIVSITKEGIYVATGQDIIKIMDVQFDSCRKMCVDQYICGHTINEGDKFG